MQICVEILRKANKALPKICVGPQWMLLLLPGGPFLLLFALLHSEHAALFGSPLRSLYCEDIHYYAEQSGGAVCLSVTLLLAFFSHPHLIMRGGVSED